MPQTFALYNLKGGVGKTAATVNLAWHAAEAGLRTLVWDLDPQGAASFYLRAELDEADSADHWLKSKHFADRICGTDFVNLDIIPASLALRHIDVELASRKHAGERLQRLLEGLPFEYDLILLDCAPSLSMVSENVFALADTVMVPVIPTHLSVRAYKQLAPFARTPGQLMPFFSMVDRRRSLHRQLIGEFAAAHSELLRRFVPYTSDIEKMGTYRAPVGTFSRASVGARAFKSLWEAVAERTQLLPATA